MKKKNWMAGRLFQHILLVALLGGAAASWPAYSSSLFSNTGEVGTAGWVENFPSMLAPRAFHTATTLSDGSVLVVGPAGPPATLAAERYFYNDGWLPVGGDNEAIFRAKHTATLLSDGTVLFIGGQEEGHPERGGGAV